MKVQGRDYRTIWPTANGAVEVIDQTKLPHRFETVRLETTEDAARAIRTMIVRGAPLIGATGAYGLALAAQTDASDAGLKAAAQALAEARSIGYRSVRLDTIPSLMQPAIALYRELGFREIPPYRENPIPGALYFELQLSVS